MNSKARTALLKAWYDETLKSYFPDSDEAFRRNTGFANPVGQAFQESMAVILDGIAEQAAASEFAAPLDRVVRVLAVQGLPAGVAIRFLFVLRDLLDKNADLSPSDKKKWQKPYLIIAANIAIVQTHLFHFIQNSRLWVTKCNRIFRMGFVLSA